MQFNKNFSVNFCLEFTPKTFWAILPAININVKSRTLEFEFLCFAFYIDVINDNKIMINHDVHYGKTIKYVDKNQ